MREILQQAFENMQKNERHNSYGETQYWCDQYKMFAVRLLAELAKPESTPRQRIQFRQDAWNKLGQEYRDDSDVCFAMGFDAGYNALRELAKPESNQC